MSYTFNQTELGAGNIQINVLWSVTAKQYKLQSNLQFSQLVRTIFDVADALEANVPRYRLLEPNQATSDSNENVGAGKDASAALTTGIQNSAYGSKALKSATTGIRNVAVGWSAGFLTNGSDNVVVGANSLVGAGTGSFNTILGASVSANATQSYQVMLGYAANSPAPSGSLSIGGTGSNAMVNLNVATAGGAAVGEYLNIYINGVQRKIALLLP